MGTFEPRQGIPICQSLSASSRSRNSDPRRRNGSPASALCCCPRLAILWRAFGTPFCPRRRESKSDTYAARRSQQWSTYSKQKYTHAARGSQQWSTYFKILYPRCHGAISAVKYVLEKKLEIFLNSQHGSIRSPGPSPWHNDTVQR